MGGASNTQWELEEGIPQQDDPFIQQYLRGRTSLIVEEQKQRHGGTPSPRSIRETYSVSKPPCVSV